MSMANTPAHAEKWTRFIAARAEFPHGGRLVEAFRAGKITRLCDCGCNSFDIAVPDGAATPLCGPGKYGSVFQLDFKLRDDEGTLSFCVFVDERGHLEGIDVDYCANSFPMPEAPVVQEPPIDVVVSSALDI
jgi:hypothetical protein